jgi:hypothetical protein
MDKTLSEEAGNTRFTAHNPAPYTDEEKETVHKLVEVEKRLAELEPLVGDEARAEYVFGPKDNRKEIEDNVNRYYDEYQELKEQRMQLGGKEYNIVESRRPDSENRNKEWHNDEINRILDEIAASQLEALYSEAKQVDQFLDANFQEIKNEPDKIKKEILEKSRIPYYERREEIWKEFGRIEKEKEERLYQEKVKKAEHMQDEFYSLFNKFKSNPELKNDTEFKKQITVFCSSADNNVIANLVVGSNDLLYLSDKGNNIGEESQIRLDFVKFFMIPYAIEKGIVIKTKSKKEKYKLKELTE